MDTVLCNYGELSLLLTEQIRVCSTYWLIDILLYVCQGLDCSRRCHLVLICSTMTDRKSELTKKKSKPGAVESEWLIFLLLFPLFFFVALSVKGWFPVVMSCY